VHVHSEQQPGWVQLAALPSSQSDDEMVCAGIGYSSVVRGTAWLAHVPAVLRVLW
jgi:hypothetical protein